MQDVITTDRYLAAFPQNYHKTDVFVRGSCFWRSRQVNPPRTDETLLVIGHSDYPLTDQIAAHYWRATCWGVNSQSLRVRGLPLGITNDCDDGPTHRILGDTRIMREVAEESLTARNRVYMNFSLDTHPCRQTVWQMFQDKAWVTKGTMIQTLVGRRDFLREIRNHAFVLCPRGNGVDTHRLWETLYMGRIPIVQRDIAHRDWEDLPIAWVNDWNEVTPEWLDSEEKRIREGTFAMEKLDVNYWIQKIRESVGTPGGSV